MNVCGWNEDVVRGYLAAVIERLVMLSNLQYIGVISPPSYR